MSGRSKQITPGDGDPRHGTPNGYKNCGCRGDCCRDVWRVDRAAYYAQHPDKALDRVTRVRRKRRAISAAKRASA